MTLGVCLFVLTQSFEQKSRGLFLYFLLPAAGRPCASPRAARCGMQGDHRSPLWTTSAEICDTDGGRESPQPSIKHARVEWVEEFSPFNSCPACLRWSACLLFAKTKPNDTNKQSPAHWSILNELSTELVIPRQALCQRCQFWGKR